MATNAGMARRRARLTRGFVPQVAAAVPQSERACHRGDSLVSGSRTGVGESIHRAAREDAFRPDRLGRVRAGRGAGCESAGERVDRQAGYAVRRDRQVHAFGRRARYGDARHPREGVPRAGLPRAGRPDAQQSPGVHGFGRGAGFRAVAVPRAAAGVAQSGQGVSEPGAGPGEATAGRSRLRAGCARTPDAGRCGDRRAPSRAAIRCGSTNRAPCPIWKWCARSRRRR